MHFVGIDMVYGRIPNAIEIVGGESANGISREYRETCYAWRKTRGEIRMCNIFYLMIKDFTVYPLIERKYRYNIKVR